MRHHVLLALYDLLYGPLAKLYRAAGWIVSLGRWETWQTSILPFVPGGPILDLGCGPGVLLPKLGGIGWTVGVDRSERMAQIARSRGPIVIAMAQDLPFAGSTFRAVVTTFPAPFVLDGRTIGEITAVLGPGGRFVAMPEVDCSPSRDRVVSPAESAGDFDIGSLTGRLLTALDAAGFRSSRIERKCAGAHVRVVVADRPGDRPEATRRALGRRMDGTLDNC